MNEEYEIKRQRVIRNRIIREVFFIIALIVLGLAVASSERRAAFGDFLNECIESGQVNQISGDDIYSIKCEAKRVKTIQQD